MQQTLKILGVLFLVGFLFFLLLFLLFSIEPGRTIPKVTTVSYLLPSSK